MKAVLCLTLLCAFVALSTAETCGSDKDCQHVTCPESDYMLECHRGQCTCTHTTATCSDQNDCSDDNCRFGWHCVDGKCRCGLFSGIGGIGK